MLYGDCRMQKKRKKKKNVAARPRMIGFSSILIRELRRFAVPVTVFAVICVVAAALTAVIGTVTLYVLFYISAVGLCAAVAVTAAYGTVTDADDPGAALSGVAASDRVYVRAGTVTTAKCISALVVSVLSAGVIFGCALLIYSPLIGAAAALAFMSAAFYVTLVACSSSAVHDPRKAKGRRGFILGFAGLYTVGLLALMLILAFSSAIPLGEDFTGDSIPSGTIFALSVIYLAATAIRSVYLYFILRRRLRARMKLR